MKKIFTLILLLNSLAFAQIKFGEAKGLFMAVGVGPRFPIGDFSDNQNIGVGTNVTFSYTDNEFLPVFLYANIGYEHYPGRQDFYKHSDYASFSSNLIVIAAGARYFFPPVIDEGIILMPILDAGIEFAYFEKFHQFKIDRGRQNYVEEVGKLGFQIGGGFSMFILDVVTYYHYLQNNHYISFDLRVNIPIFVKI
ncbi:MAG: hypothetical protein AB1521_01540 [Bacteroidota bacterium]